MNMRDNLLQTSPVKMSNVVSRRERRITSEQIKLKKKEVVDSILAYLDCQSEHEIPESHFFFFSLVEKEDWYEVWKQEKFCPHNSSHEIFRLVGATSNELQTIFLKKTTDASKVQSTCLDCK